MCGIVGYIGEREAMPILLDGLQRLEYRGYDSAGVAVVDGNALRIAKAGGRLQVLRERLAADPLAGCIGMGHTRWATHGAPRAANAHPHLSRNGRFAVVHNGIIENYRALKEMLQARGVTFCSETDTEVIAQLLETEWDGDLPGTLRRVTMQLSGSYALAVLCADQPDRICAVRRDSPLILGFGMGEQFLASDIPALLPYTRSVYRLQDGELAVLTRHEIQLFHADGRPAGITPEQIGWTAEAAEKDGFRHFMLKEIFEQPRAVRDTLSMYIRDGRIVLEALAEMHETENMRRICIAACGTAYHVALAAKYMLESLLRIPVEADMASEFRYRDPVLDPHTLMLVISQSGETADTLAALRKAKRCGCRVAAVVNAMGSTIAAEADAVLYTRAGPEISVASTKAYSTQLTVMALLGLYLADRRDVLMPEQQAAYLAAFRRLPGQLEEVLACREVMQHMASRLFRQEAVYFIGRGLDYASALEGALKLKEISYIRAEGFSAGELKHGPISLIEPGTPVVALAADMQLFGKMMSNIQEVRARGALILGVTTTGMRDMESETKIPFYLPKTERLLQPILTAVPLQLLAYYTAAMRGCEIDQPRNLAKSVTVE